VYWQKFDPEAWNFEFDEDELAAHSSTIDEAVEVLWNRFQAQRNKAYHGGYQLIGATDGGRRLKLIVYEKEPNRLIRVITGWDI
jgi:uncharacterized DUF497 family protein